MKFILVDRINSLDPPKRIATSKALSLAEEYLADHFPTFPVMPGVLMLETIVQSAAWLVRVTEDFAHSMIVLEEARNINYKSFVSPGRTLDVTVDAIRIEDRSSEFRAVGRCGEREMVKARLRLRHYNIADQDAAMADVDRRIVQDARQRFQLLNGPSAVRAAVATTGDH